MSSATDTRVAIEFRDATRDFGTTKALDGVSFAIPEGSITGVIGRSGAGESTLIRTAPRLPHLSTMAVRRFTNANTTLGRN